MMAPQVFVQFFHIVILEFYRNAAQIEHGIFQIVFDEMKSDLRLRLNYFID